MEKFLKIGAVTSTHGVKGEVKVYPTTDDPTRFEDLDEVILTKNSRQEIHEIQSVRYFKNMVILKLKDIDDMTKAETYKTWDIIIPREMGVELEEDEYYQADLIGLEVSTEEGEYLGKLKDVLETGANDVYVVKTEQYGEVLIPAIKACILNVDIEGGKMLVHLLPGLIG
ncbi:MAG: ribosome maturation factor RimM [Eubacteriales bacterium]|nr:ribosome maturation factor RimM [Eubacteriales bacterium]